MKLTRATPGRDFHIQFDSVKVGACDLAFKPLSAGVSKNEPQKLPRGRHGTIHGRVDRLRVARKQPFGALRFSSAASLSRGEEQAEDYRRQDGPAQAEEAVAQLRTGAGFVVNGRVRSGQPHVDLSQIQAAPGIVHGQRPGAGRSGDLDR